MLHTNTTRPESHVLVAPLVPSSSVHLATADLMEVRAEQGEVAIDDALAASFPASDPPGWNPGLARPRPVDASRRRAAGARVTAELEETVAGTPGVIDVSRPPGSERTPLDALISLVGAVGIALLVPVVMLLVLLPITLAVRGAFGILQWLFPAIGY